MAALFLTASFTASLALLAVGSPVVQELSQVAVDQSGQLDTTQGLAPLVRSAKIQTTKPELVTVDHHGHLDAIHHDLAQGALAPGPHAKAQLEVSPGGVVGSDSAEEDDPGVQSGHDDVISSAQSLEQVSVHTVTDMPAEYASGAPAGYCWGKITNDFECEEFHSKDKKGRKLVKGGSNCTVKCIGDLKGRTAEPASVNCKCQINNQCTWSMRGLKCSSAIGGSGCFPRSAQLLQSSGFKASVASLQAGAQVMGLSSGHEGVQLNSDAYLGDTHDSTTEARDGSLHPFLEIRHACGGTQPLRITAEHLVFVVDPVPSLPRRRLERAGSLRPGLDSLLALGCKTEASGDSSSQLAPSMVLSLQEVWAEGLYNPMTSSGTAIVDGVATSNAALATDGISTAWQATPSIRRNGETIAQAVLLPPRLLHSLGVPWSWIHSRSAHVFYMGLIDAIFRCGAWMLAS